jgi:hypothetical protein
LFNWFRCESIWFCDFFLGGSIYHHGSCDLFKRVFSVDSLGIASFAQIVVGASLALEPQAFDSATAFIAGRWVNNF